MTKVYFLFISYVHLRFGRGLSSISFSPQDIGWWSPYHLECSWLPKLGEGKIEKSTSAFIYVYPEVSHLISTFGQGNSYSLVQLNGVRKWNFLMTRVIELEILVSCTNTCHGIVLLSIILRWRNYPAVRMAKIEEICEYKALTKMCSILSSHALMIGMQNGTGILKNSLEVSFKVKHILTI